MCDLVRKYTPVSFDQINDGIVHFFNNIPNDNVYNYINVEGESYSGWGPPDTVINYSISSNSPNDQWVSPREQQYSFIVFHFKYPLFLTHYTIKTRTDKSETFPRYWVVDAYNDSTTSVRIDTIENDNHLTSRGAYHTYKTKQNILLSTLKITLTRATLESRFHFHISRVEFYGKTSFPLNSGLCKYVHYLKITNKESNTNLISSIYLFILMN